MTKPTAHITKIGSSVYRVFLEGHGFISLLVGLAAVAIAPLDTKIWWLLLSILYISAYEIPRVVREYRHPRLRGLGVSKSEPRLPYYLLGILVVFTLGPWLLLKWRNLSAELSWLLPLWIASGVICLLWSNRHHN